MVDVLRREFADLELTFSIGGQISMDIFPKVGCPRRAAVATVAVFGELWTTGTS